MTVPKSLKVQVLLSLPLSYQHSQESDLWDNIWSLGRSSGELIHSNT